MSLPIPNSPIFTVKLLSVKDPVKFKPFTVLEEKIFLIAEEGGDEKEILYAIRQVLSNCCVSKIDVNKLPLFDVEYFFLQLRAKSVSNISTVKYRDNEDNIVRDFDIDLDSIVPIENPNHKTSFKLTDTMAVNFKYPTIEDLLGVQNLKINDLETAIETISVCLDVIVDGEEVYEASNYSREEKIDFINGLSTKQFEGIVETFVETMPKMQHIIKYVNALGNDREIILEGFRSFFQ